MGWEPTTVPYAKFGDPQTLNLYSYVENDPINEIDADGHAQQAANQEGSNACSTNPQCAENKQGAAVAGAVVTSEAPTTETVTGAAAKELVQGAETVGSAGESLGSKLLSAAGTVVEDAVAVPLMIIFNPIKTGGAGDTPENPGDLGNGGNKAAPEPAPASGGAGARKGGDIDRMRQGKPPIGADGHPVELHHPGQNTGSVQEMTRSEHRLGSNYRANHPEGNKIKSRINRAEAARQRREYWQRKAGEGQ